MYINKLDGIFGTINCQTWVKDGTRIIALILVRFFLSEPLFLIQHFIHYPELFIKSADTIIKSALRNNISFYVGIFNLSGEPILPHLLCCGPIAVDDHSFMGRRLASAATSTRE